LQGFSKSAVILKWTRELLKPEMMFLMVISILLITSIGLPGCSNNSISVTKPPVQGTDTIKIDPPDVILIVDKSSLSLNGMTLGIQAMLTNTNDRSITVDDIKLDAQNEKGVSYGQGTIPGGLITPKETRTFRGNIVASNDAVTEKKLTVTLVSKAILSSASVAVNATATYSVPDLSKLAVAPKMTLQPKMGQLTLDGVLVQLAARLDGSIYNPNPFRLDVGVIQLTVKGKSGNTFFNDMLQGTSLLPNDTFNFASDIKLPLQALNEGGVTMIVDTMGGIGQSTLPIKASAGITAPKLKDLISIPKLTINLKDIPSNWQTGGNNRPVYSILIQADLKNDNIFKLNVADLHANVYKPKTTLIDSVTIASASFHLGIPGNTTTSVYSNWTSITWDVIGPQGGDANVIIDTTIGIDGINERIPVSATAIIPFKAQWSP
jgi:LEA14-like dessication related protein